MTDSSSRPPVWVRRQQNKMWKAVNAAKVRDLPHGYTPKAAYVPWPGEPVVPKKKRRSKNKVLAPAILKLPPGMTLLQALIHFQGRRCIICGEPMSPVNPFTGKPWHGQYARRPTFEHVVPRSRGGRNHGNRLASHSECNNARGDRPPTGCELIWLAVINARLEIRIDPQEDLS